MESNAAGQLTLATKRVAQDGAGVGLGDVAKDDRHTGVVVVADAQNLAEREDVGCVERRNLETNLDVLAGLEVGVFVDRWHPETTIVDDNPSLGHRSRLGLDDALHLGELLAQCPNLVEHEDHAAIEIFGSFRPVGLIVEHTVGLDDREVEDPRFERFDLFFSDQFQVTGQEASHANGAAAVLIVSLVNALAHLQYPRGQSLVTFGTTIRDRPQLLDPSQHAMLHLHKPTDEGWFDRVEPHLDTILLDHAHLEKRAASAAMSMMFRYTDKPDLARALAEVVHEEVEHFTQMLDILADRGVAYESIEPASYAGRLMKQTAKKDPDALLDKLIVSSLIEARSCERFRLLADRLDDPELAEFYRELMVSEARHHTLYTNIARELFDTERVNRRLDELARIEWEALTASTEAPRLHSF